MLCRKEADTVVIDRSSLASTPLLFVVIIMSELTLQVLWGLALVAVCMFIIECCVFEYISWLAFPSGKVVLTI